MSITMPMVVHRAREQLGAVTGLPVSSTVSARKEDGGWRVEVAELNPETRKSIFEEVEMPISEKDAYREAERCMRCYRISMVITER